MKSIIAFDLDGTIAESKSALTHEMSNALTALLRKNKVAIISGAAFPQFNKQVIACLPNDAALLSNLFIFPTNGSRMQAFKNGTWDTIYEEALTEEERKKIISAIETSIAEINLTVEKTYGPQIEDRREQVTFSAIGQLAPVSVKKVWDPDQKIRLALAARIQAKIPEFEVKVGGMTSIDITRKGIDKAYAITKIEQHLGVKKDDILFIGDAIFPGGNDYAVQEAGVESVKVSGPEETVKVIHHLLTI